MMAQALKKSQKGNYFALFWVQVVPGRSSANSRAGPIAILTVLFTYHLVTGISGFESWFKVPRTPPPKGSENCWVCVMGFQFETLKS